MHSIELFDLPGQNITINSRLLVSERRADLGGPGG